MRRTAVTLARERCASTLIQSGRMAEQRSLGGSTGSRSLAVEGLARGSAWAPVTHELKSESGQSQGGRTWLLTPVSTL